MMLDARIFPPRTRRGRAGGGIGWKRKSKDDVLAFSGAIRSVWLKNDLRQVIVID